MKTNITTILIALFIVKGVHASDYTLTSPDGRNVISLNDDDGIRLSVSSDGQPLLRNTSIDLRLDLRGKAVSAGAAAHSQQTDKGTNRGKRHAVTHHTPDFDVIYNYLTISYGSILLELRAFDEGVAYRWRTHKVKGSYTVTGEQADFTFPQDFYAYLPHSTNPEKPEAMAFQATFDVAPISRQKSLLAFLPATIDCKSAKVTLLESDLRDYPGMFITPKGVRLKAEFPKYPKTMKYHDWRHMTYVADTEDYLARCEGSRTFPWRVISITHDDTQMPTTNIVAALAEPARIDGGWVRPGRVAWDWWNDWGLQGVGFKAGINTETYRHYIDFASRNHLEYIILDEGWYDSRSGDIMNPIPEIDLPALIEYGRQKNVKIILWCVFNVLDEHLEEACRKYSEMGIVGFKADFMDRQDQTAVDMTWRIAEACARHHLMLDYHGIFSPAGINITYPNVINFEAVFGMEEVKWTPHGEKDMPLYDVTFPYIRLQAGPVDFTPGGMRNATREDFQPVYSSPMTMGTRCHQMAHYIVHFAPLLMFADSPSAYDREPECTQMLASLPSQYTSMKTIAGEMGKYIVVMRTDADGNYYLAGETNWDARDIKLPLSFLPAGTTCHATIMTDGLNADKVATDYQSRQFDVTSATTLEVHMASGGGFIMKIMK